MKWNRIVFKLGGTIMLLILMVLLPLGYVIDRIFAGFYYKQTQEEINKYATRFARMVSQSPDLMTINMMEMMARFSGEPLFIADQEGKIMVRSDELSLIGNEVPKEWKVLFKGKAIDHVYKDPVSGRRFLVSGQPITRGNAVTGGVFVLSSLDEIDRSIRTARELIVLSGIGAIFLALGFTWFLTRKLSGPLLQMEQATRQISKGNLAARVQVHAGDEIGSLAQAINDMANDLQKIHDIRREFFANISHELRTPITYLEGYAKVLKEGLYQNEEEKVRYLNIIQQESKRLARLIHDLFELSKMEEGRIHLDLEWIDLGEVVESAVQKLGLKAREKGLEIRTDVQDDLPLIHADGLRMEQIVLNLLDNAIRYTEMGEVFVRVAKSGVHRVMMQVEDTGTGIPEEELPLIFERFYRVDKSRSREYGGTGLGLSIVKSLVELQGGSIRVLSQAGKGTRFEIIFPVSNDNESEEKQE